MHIVEVEAIIIRFPDVDVTIGDGSQDDLIVRIVTDEGIIGYGEVDSSPEVVRACIETPSSHKAARGLGEMLIGADPLDPTLWEQLYRQSSYYGRRGVAIHALSGIDIALWDIRGQAAGKPISELLTDNPSSVRTHIPAYASLLMPATPAAVADKIHEVRDAGFQAVKFGWGVLGRDPHFDGSLATAARAAGGDDMRIMIDAGLGYGTDVASAAIAARHFEDAGIYWFEEPFDADAYDAYASLAGETSMRISAGEQEATRWGFRELIERAGIAIAQPDVSRCGGLTETLEIAAVCAERGVELVPHAWKSGILMAATLHLNAILEQPAGGFQEAALTATGLSKALVRQQFAVDDQGMIEVPTAPGLGIELDHEFMARHTVS